MKKQIYKSNLVPCDDGLMRSLQQADHLYVYIMNMRVYYFSCTVMLIVIIYVTDVIDNTNFSCKHVYQNKLMSARSFMSLLLISSCRLVW